MTRKEISKQRVNHTGKIMVVSANVDILNKKQVIEQCLMKTKLYQFYMLK